VERDGREAVVWPAAGRRGEVVAAHERERERGREREGGRGRG
jgi:hypothetical protein